MVLMTSKILCVDKFSITKIQIYLYTRDLSNSVRLLSVVVWYKCFLCMYFNRTLFIIQNMTLNMKWHKIQNSLPYFNIIQIIFRLEQQQGKQHQNSKFKMIYFVFRAALVLYILLFVPDAFFTLCFWVRNYKELSAYRLYIMSV